MVRLQTLDLRIGVRVPASQPSSCGTGSSLANNPSASKESSGAEVLLSRQKTSGQRQHRSWEGAIPVAHASSQYATPSLLLRLV